MNRYMNNLFRIYRRRYGVIKQLVRTDREHPYWAVADGQPVCSRKTVNNLEQGRCQTDEDTLIFLIGKLGFRYVSGQKDADELIMIAGKLKKAFAEGNGSEVEIISKMTDALDYRGVFLFDIWHQLLKSACCFYRHNSLREFEQLASLRTEMGIFPPAMEYLFGYLQVFQAVFYSGNFAFANLTLGKLGHINELDQALLIIAQSETESLMQLESRLFTRRIRDLEPLQHDRLLYWLKRALNGYLGCRWMEIDGAPVTPEDDRIRRAAEECCNRTVLRKIRSYQNPQISSLYRRRTLDLVRQNHRYRILYDVIEQLEL